MTRAWLVAPILVLLLASCASSASPTVPNEKEWGRLLAEYQSLETFRRSLPSPPAQAARADQIRVHLENQQRLEPKLRPFLAAAAEYLERTGDTRAGRLIANERMRLGDAYLSVLSRYDRAIQMYESALAVDPSNDEARKRIEIARERQFVSFDRFASLRDGMSEGDVAARLGTPREDWIKHLTQNNRLYSVWIYSRADGGAAAVYFENGIVYHTNWNAAQARQGQTP